MIKTYRIPFLMLAIVCLLAGLWTGLVRIGWDIKPLPVAAHHGAIMIGGFLGTLISLEKIIPLRNKILYVIPVISGLSVVCFLLQQNEMAVWALTTASVGLSVVFFIYLIRERTLIYLLTTLGGLAWLAGNITLLRTGFYPAAYPWWAAFTLLVISAERLELTAFLPVSRKSKIVFCVLLLLFVVGVIVSFHGIGNIISGCALVGVSAWLLRFDLIGISIKKSGLTKYVAVALFAGYVSLLLTGMLFITATGKSLGYDAVVHGFFIGFVFSMILAHGPIILPGVLGVSAKPFHNILYVWLTLLHISWLLRVSGDLFLDFDLRRISGILTAAAIIGYFATMATLTFRSQVKSL